MGLFGHIFYCVLYLMALTTDVLILLFLARLIRPHTTCRPIAAVDDAARPVVDGLVADDGPAGGLHDFDVQALLGIEAER